MFMKTSDSLSKNKTLRMIYSPGSKNRFVQHSYIDSVPPGNDALNVVVGSDSFMFI